MTEVKLIAEINAISNNRNTAANEKSFSIKYNEDTQSQIHRAPEHSHCQNYYTPSTCVECDALLN